MCLSKEGIHIQQGDLYPERVQSVGSVGLECRGMVPVGLSLWFWSLSEQQHVKGVPFLKEGVMAFLLITRRLACSSQKNLHLFTTGKPHQNPDMTCSLRDAVQMRGLWSESLFPRFLSETITMATPTPSTDGHFSCRKGVDAAQSRSAQEGWPLSQKDPEKKTVLWSTESHNREAEGVCTSGAECVPSTQAHTGLNPQRCMN